MAKNWWFQFHFKDWRNDSALRRCSLETRGFWIEVLCVMHELGGYELRGSTEELARLLGCFPEEVARLAIELKRTGTAEVEIGASEVVLISRRLKREAEERNQARKRQAKFRENGGGDPERWTAIRAVILTRDGKRCAYCGKYATTVDHVQPRAQGGEHDEENLVAACKKCNEKKNNRTPEQAGMSFHTTFNQKQLASNTQVTRQSNKKEVISKNKKEESVSNETKKRTKKEKKPHVEEIEMIRRVCKLYPPEETWEALAHAVQQNPSEDHLTQCFKEWRLRGFKPTNYAWVTNWHVHGIPNGDPRGPKIVTTNAELQNILLPCIP